MINGIVFDTEVTLYWQIQKEFKECYTYAVFLNGIQYGETAKTHYEFYFLSPETSYNFKVVLLDENKQLVSLVGEQVFTTAKMKRRIDVTSNPYNAVGDGKTLNTVAIQKALDDCTECDCVYFPAGEFLTGALNIHSDTEVYIEKDCLIRGTDNPHDYLPKIDSRYEGIERKCYASLFNIGTMDKNAVTCENVILRGGGKIIGGGRKLQDNIIIEESHGKSLKIDLDDHPGEFWEAFIKQARMRGRLINISSCRNVVISGLSCCDGPAWNIHMIYSENIITAHCKIETHRVHNGDGWDPDSSNNCVIFDCDFCTSDDCIAIKSGKNLEGNIINRPSFNIFVFDIRIKAGYGISVGSEMSGGVYNVWVWDIASDCVGVTIKSAEKRGGYVHNVNVFNSRLGSITITATIDYNNDEEDNGGFAELSDFHFENITITGQRQRIFKDKINRIEKCFCSPILINGLDEHKHFINNVVIKNCCIIKQEANCDILYKNAKNVMMKDVKYI